MGLFFSPKGVLIPWKLMLNYLQIKLYFFKIFFKLFQVSGGISGSMDETRWVMGDHYTIVILP